MGGGQNWRELGPLRTSIVPKVWFAGWSAATVFILPFLTILWRTNCGFSEELIGLMCALRPWVAAAGGSLIVSAADASQRHMACLVAVFLVAWLGRSVMALFTGFAAQLAISLVTEAAASPMGSLIDAAVMASQGADEGGYGRIRMWASIGWGGTAPIAGWVVGTYGLDVAFMLFAGLAGLMLLPTLLLPMEALSKKQAASGTRGAAGSSSSCGDGDDGYGSWPRLSCLGACFDKVGGKGLGGSEVGEVLAALASGAPAGGGGGDDDQLLSVHVSAGSQSRQLAGEGSGHGGKRGAPAPLARTWTIGARPPSNNREAAAPLVISLVADASSTALPGSLLHSLERPLISPSAAAPLGGAYASSPLEISVGAAPASAAGKSRPVSLSESAAAGAEAGGDVSVWQGVKGLLADVHVLVFLALALLMGVGNGAMGFLFLYLDELGAGGTLMGLCLSFNCAAEVPMFYFSGTILQKIGIDRALQLAMGAYIVRLCCYLALPFMPSPWCVLPVELLQGLTFALAWSAGTVHVKRIAPPHLRGTVQSVFAGLYTGIGAGLGGLAGGLLYGSFGPAALFRTAALTLAVGWLAATAVLRLWGGGSISGVPGTAGGHGEGQGAQGAVVVRQAARENSEDGEEAALLRA